MAYDQKNTIALTQSYSQRIADYNDERRLYAGQQKFIPLSRVVSFLLSIYFIYAYIAEAHLWKAGLALLFFSGFLFLGWLDVVLKRKIQRCERFAEINQQELNACKGDYSAFDPGSEFVDHEHPYTHDLDIFGVNSLFQCINRTATIFGKNRLADYLKNAWHYRQQIPERQAAVRELSENVTFRQQIRLIFFGQSISESDRASLEVWLQSQAILKHPLLLKILITVLPIITISTIIFSILGMIVYQVPVMLVLFQFLLVTLYSWITIQTQTAITSKFNILEKYARYLEMIENAHVESPYLKQLNNCLTYEGVKPPSKVIRSLSHLRNLMDANLNLPVSATLNGLFMFNLYLLLAVEKWKTEHRSLIPQWFEVMAEVDALASLANFACNNPDNAYPKPFYDEFVLHAVNMGHPLIPQQSCITNSIDMKGWNQFCIITGANMSGKSTFLRTVGTNYILAMMGAPVFADEFTFYPIELHSSIRTSDSLSKNESYFYAELKRLKQIIGELEKGHQKLILLDEILKGTNSKDKQAGSIALIRQLLRYKLAGMFATHDLALGELKSHYPDNINNLCFEIEIADDQMQIDYKLREGVCKNLNATFLMKNMGILVDE